MNHDSRDGTFFIGLHKLAQQNGDGLVPELYELLTRRPDELEETDKIVRFPIGRTRLPHTDVPEITGQVISIRSRKR